MLLLSRFSSNPLLRLLVVVVLGIALNSQGLAVTPLDFAKDILPILERSCLPCHNATKSEGELNIETPQLMLKGGEKGPVIKPNHALESMLYRTAARLEKPYMPPAENKSKAVPLTSLQLEILRRWIDEGAVGHGKEREVPAWAAKPARLKSISALAVTAQGTVAAAARGQQVMLYDLLLKQPQTSLPEDAHPDIVNALAFSPDGSTLATGTFGEVRLWKRQAPTVTASTAKVEVPAGELAVRSADGKLLLTAPANSPAKLTSADGKTTIADLRLDRVQVEAQATLELSVGAAEFELSYHKQEQQKAEQQQKTFDEENKRATAEHADFEKRKPAIAKKVAEARQKQLDLKKALDAATTAQGSATVAKATAEKEQTDAAEAARKADKVKDKAAPADKPTAEQAWKDAQALAQQATQKREQAVKLLAEADKKQKQAATDHNEATKALNEAMSEVGTAADAARTAQKAADDATAGKALVVLNAKLIASAQAARDTAAKAKADFEKAQPPVTSAFRGAAFSKDGLVIVSTHEDGCARAWSSVTGRPLWTARLDSQKLGPIALQGDALVFLKADGSAQQLDIAPRWTQSGRLGDAGSPASPLTDRVNALAFSPDGKLLATGSGDPSRSGEIKLWKTASGKLVREFAKPHKDAVLTLSFSSDGLHLASGAADRAVRIWEVKTGKMLRNLEAHSNHVLGVSFRHDGRRLASAGADNAIRTWNLQSGDVVKAISDFKKEVTGVQYVEHRNLLLASAGDPELRLLNDEGPTTRSAKNVSKSFLTALAVTPDGKTELLGTASGDLLVFDGEGKQVVAFPATETSQGAP